MAESDVESVDDRLSHFLWSLYWRSYDGTPIPSHSPRRVRSPVVHFAAQGRFAEFITIVRKIKPATVRLGAVSYLNSKPLIQDLAALLPGSEISLEYPSRLADSLADGDLDVALIPSIEYLRNPGHDIISDACVAARGEVLSVKLYCRCHPGSVQRIAMDEGSRTSATLARIILAERFGAKPEIEPLSMDSLTTETSADAVLLIGDRAMHTPDEEFYEVMDLGDVWYKWTGLPFVFAMWVARHDADVTGIAGALNEARDRGVSAIRKIARVESPKLHIAEDLAVRYLTKNLHYRMTSAERSGLELFHQLAIQNNLVTHHARHRRTEPAVTEFVAAGTFADLVNP